jgi:hypothetical protein
MGQLNTITPHDTAVKTYKKYIFPYIIGKVEHMDTIMSQTIRRFFSLIGEALRTLSCSMVSQGKPIRTFFQPLSFQVKHSDANMLHGTEV